MSSDRHPVDLLAEEFAAAIREGQDPQIADWIRRCPEHAEMIQAVFPSIALVERVRGREFPAAETKPPLELHLAQPRVLGDFVILREIGRGGMGVVYEAVQQSLKRRVALKVIGARIAGSESQRLRFRREAESAASLHHSNIVPVYGIGEDQGLQYFAMQLIESVTLADVVNCLRGSDTTGTGSRSSDTNTARQDHPRSPGQVLSEPARNGQSGAAAADDRTGCIGDKPASSGSVAPTPPRRRFETADAVRALLGSRTLSEQIPLNRASSPNGPRPTQESADAAGVLGLKSHTFRPGAKRQNRRRNRLQNGHAGGNPFARTSVPLVSASGAGTLTSPGPQYSRNIARLMANVASAVNHAHRHGILHRDIKPGNLLLDREGTVWVSDFGLARHVDVAGMTQTGEIVGTLRYMAPEQIRGQSDARSDVYALGVTLYELLTLQPAVNTPRVLGGGSAEIQRPRKIRPDIPADLETITLKACLPEPERRYQSAGAFEADLRRFLEDRPILARRTSWAGRFRRWARRNPAVATLSGASVMLLILIAGLLAVGNHEKQRALDEISRQYDRAERNLQEKSQALAAVEREHARAEKNLDLAVRSFAAVFDNIAARGRLSPLLVDPETDEGELPTADDAVLSSADVTLLESLLGFFDQFAAENTKDLTAASADARRRVGDIQQQLGRRADAEESWLRALADYQAVSASHPDDHQLLLQQAAVLNELMASAATRGDITLARKYYDQTRTLLNGSASLQNAPEGRFAVATTVNRLVSFSLNLGPDVRPTRLRSLFAFRQSPSENSPNAAQNSRLRREAAGVADANAEAVALLKKLVAEDPEQTRYMAALAQSQRDEARIARVGRDFRKADQALQAAIQTLEQLREQLPDSETLKYELAQTLAAAGGSRPAELQRSTQALRLARELAESHPDIADYRTLYGNTLLRLAAQHVTAGRTARAQELLQEALAWNQKLADQFPDVIAGQVALARTQQYLAELRLQQNEPEQAKSLLDDALKRMETFSNRSRRQNALQPFIRQLRDARSRIDQSASSAK